MFYICFIARVYAFVICVCVYCVCWCSVTELWPLYYNPVAKLCQSTLCSFDWYIHTHTPLQHKLLAANMNFLGPLTHGPTPQSSLSTFAHIRIGANKSFKHKWECIKRTGGAWPSLRGDPAHIRSGLEHNVPKLAGLFWASEVLTQPFNLLRLYLQSNRRHSSVYLCIYSWCSYTYIHYVHIYIHISYVSLLSYKAAFSFYWFFFTSLSPLSPLPTLFCSFCFSPTLILQIPVNPHYIYSLYTSPKIWYWMDC